eukprot:GFKZ01014906.1.p3 GENE.GFKZ01014906.1~~GFKZ01014906.1.p3  ORF type:complete len:109 (+),score=3.40 GFKZ01014906.1:441-767(+)
MSGSYLPIYLEPKMRLTTTTPNLRVTPSPPHPARPSLQHHLQPPAVVHMSTSTPHTPSAVPPTTPYHSICRYIAAYHALTPDPVNVKTLQADGGVMRREYSDCLRQGE